MQKKCKEELCEEDLKEIYDEKNEIVDENEHFDLMSGLTSEDGELYFRKSMKENVSNAYRKIMKLCKEESEEEFNFLLKEAIDSIAEDSKVLIVLNQIYENCKDDKTMTDRWLSEITTKAINGNKEAQEILRTIAYLHLSKPEFNNLAIIVNLPLAYIYAKKKAAKYHQEVMSMVSDAYFGIEVALSNYDMKKGTFSSFAYWNMFKKIMTSLRDNQAVVIPEGAYNKKKKIKKLIDEARDKNQSVPDVKTISKITNINIQEVVTLLPFVEENWCASLDQTYGNSIDEDTTLSDLIPDCNAKIPGEDNHIVDPEFTKLVKEMLFGLCNNREAAIVIEVCLKGFSEEFVANEFSISLERLQEIINRAVNLLDGKKLLDTYLEIRK